MERRSPAGSFCGRGDLRLVVETQIELFSRIGVEIAALAERNIMVIPVGLDVEINVDQLLVALLSLGKLAGLGLRIVVRPAPLLFFAHGLQVVGVDVGEVVGVEGNLLDGRHCTCCVEVGWPRVLVEKGTYPIVIAGSRVELGGRQNQQAVEGLHALEGVGCGIEAQA